MPPPPACMRLPLLAHDCHHSHATTSRPHAPHTLALCPHLHTVSPLTRTPCLHAHHCRCLHAAARPRTMPESHSHLHARCHHYRALMPPPHPQPSRACIPPRKSAPLLHVSTRRTLGLVTGMPAVPGCCRFTMGPSRASSSAWGSGPRVSAMSGTPRGPLADAAVLEAKYQARAETGTCLGERGKATA
jgi:hypothetical protein